jgi:hypothetical protein
MGLSNVGRTTTVLYSEKRCQRLRGDKYSRNVQKYVVNNIRVCKVENRVLKGQWNDATCLNCVHAPVYRTRGVGLYSNRILWMTCQTRKACRWVSVEMQTGMLKKKKRKTDQGLQMYRVLRILLGIEKRLERTHSGQTLGKKGRLSDNTPGWFVDLCLQCRKEWPA